MQVLAIGLGGAGSRIVDRLYDHDQRSGVGCMSVISIDIDANTLSQLRHLPDSARVFFPPIDPESPLDIATTIDIEEVMTRIQGLDTMHIDAILLCCGLGGSMVDAAAPLVQEIRKSHVEPVFALATLPCRGEGKKISAKAADDIEMLSEIADALLLFDNETWYGKIKTMFAIMDADRAGKGREAGGASSLPKNPRDIYAMLNERIARQIGLLLRAGEFNEHGVEVAEVVLDAGEVLNTLKGNGYVAVGYAAEQLPTSWLDIFSRWRSSRYFMEGSQQKAARIVSLAKRAVYEDISVPCDLTSADKALVLIAGPSAELSMKGFQTVRKWIDRSIAGLEMRSGDYPVKNTRYVGIIVMLAGLQNIPRVEDLKQIRAEYASELEAEVQKAAALEQEDLSTMPDGGEPAFGEWEEDDAGVREQELKDEMISLPGSSGDERTGERDQMISMPGRPAEGGQDDAIVLPQRPDRSPADITRMTTVHAAPAPKNSTFEAKDVRTAIAPKELDVKGGFQTRVKPVQRPKETAMTGEGVSIRQFDRPVQDASFDGRRIPLQDRLRRPSDDLLPLANRWPGGRIVRPREPDPSGGRLRVVDTPAKKEKKYPRDSDDDDFVWIT
ncbi:MAG: tubulin/FtsZ family protein [Methanomicrobiaceae archaeon]|nr:tubulin/FtsZ family protein [Methanomicrobiaceae archaeon]